MRSAKDLLIPILTLILICAVTTAILALTNDVTGEIIANNEKTAMENQLRELTPDADKYENGIMNYENVEYEYFTAFASGEDAPIAYIFITNSNGYGGNVKVMSAVSAQGSVLGVKILAMNETPGLGKKAGNESFLARYKGKNDVNDLYGKNSVDAISGATISTNAVTNAVDTALKLYAEFGEVH